MKDLLFFDADCRVGSGPNIGIRPGVTELLEDMNYYGVDKALVMHGNIAMLGALETNRELAAMLRVDESGRLRGVWCLLPRQCGEQPEPDAFFAKMKQNRIAALTLSPFEHRYIPCRLTLGKIMDAAAERRVPVLLREFSGKWRELYDFVGEFPKNIFILSDPIGKWGHDRQVRPLLENYSGFHYGMTGYWMPEGIRNLAETYGSDRILYSSGFPHYNQGSGMLQLKHSGLNADAIAEIAGKNLENLLKGAQL